MHGAILGFGRTFMLPRLLIEGTQRQRWWKNRHRAHAPEVCRSTKEAIRETIDCRGRFLLAVENLADVMAASHAYAGRMDVLTAAVN